MRLLFFSAILVSASLAAAQPVIPVEPALNEISATVWPVEAVVSPNGAQVAYVQTSAGKSEIYVTGLRAVDPRPVRVTAGGSNESSLAWSPDSRQLAFLSDHEQPGQLQLYIWGASGGAPRQLTHLKGLLATPRWSPDGTGIAILFTENLPRAAGPLDPVLPDSGVVESKVYEQRLTLIDGMTGNARQLSPADTYVYEYDWAPDAKNFVMTAAKGAGDDNWWIAQLYTMPAAGGDLHLLYKPSVQQQLATPRWSPDAKSIFFIGGLMSDEGSTGGDIFQIPAAGGSARNLTPGVTSSASNLAWPRRSANLYFTEHFDGGSAISRWDPATGKTERLWQGDESINPPFEDNGITFTDDGNTSALIRMSWQQPPEVWCGPIGKWIRKTTLNMQRKPLWGQSKSLHWTSGGYRVQGWLLYPLQFDASRKYPMVVAVHGGPASSLKPSWPRPGFNPTLLSQQGYFVFMPNPRGSYGQGEKFAMANVKDFGGGDLRDILAGVDEAIKTAPIDPQRIGITGWSYGGFMTMWAVTQSTRFRAAVAGAGLANWQSYYGENAIDQWMIPYFGASVYDDPGVYAKSSPINFIKRVKTPTLVVVGSGDGECPPPQSYEFWHALKTLGVKTQLVVYPDEGHLFHQPDHQRDVLVRTIQWFNENLR
ncbi:MAG TPA: S9 family peptidase [Bryobacteraceae bacterium]|nr:S9 family peptidase [Bryobacteraceae bacterium]